MAKLGGVGTGSHHCKERRGEEPLGGGFSDSSHALPVVVRCCEKESCF